MISAERQSRVDELFAAAADLNTDQQRRLLDENCSTDDHEFRAQVERLLDPDRLVSTSRKGFLLPSSLGVSALFPESVSADGMIGRRIGSYVIQQAIGAGGFANVFLASRADDFRQKVAIKLVDASLEDRADIVARFVFERQVLADLSHANIARLLDGGATDDGRPFLVMEFVQGTTITKYCDQHRLTVPDRLQLFQKVCRGVAYAHRRGVIHRDLKPANVLVTDDGIPKLVDFGVAKLIAPVASSARDSLTQTRFPALTPEFASPEQVRGQQVTTQSDVYSLGVILYLLLCGRQPYKLVDRSPAEVERLVCELEPPRPSAAIKRRLRKGRASVSDPSRLERGRNPHSNESSQSLHRRLKGDVDMIVMMALRKEVRRRYASADDLADDIQRYLNGHPVIAQNNTIAYRLGKRIRRNKLLTVVAALAVLFLLTGLMGVKLSLREAKRQRDHASLQAEEARRAAYDLQLVQVSNIWHRDSQRAASLLDDPSRCPPDLRDFTWQLFRRRCQRNRLTISAHVDAVHSVAYSPDGQRIASAGKDGVVRLWDANTGQLVSTFDGHEGWINSVAFAPDGKTIAAAGNDMTVTLWDVRRKSKVATFRGHTDIVSSVVFSPDGTLLASAGYDGTVRIWVTETGGERGILRGHEGAVLCVAFSADGRTLASGGKDRLVRLWSLETLDGMTLPLAHDHYHDWVLSLSFSPDGRTLASSGWNATVLLWDTTSGRLRDTLQRPGMTGHSRPIGSIAFTPDGKRLVSASDDMSIRIWDIESKQSVTTLVGHDDIIRSVALSPDGRTVVSGAYDSVIKLWNAASDLEQTTFNAHEGEVHGLAFSPDGTLLCSSGIDETVKLWDLDHNELLATINDHKAPIRTVAMSPDGEVLATGSDDGIIRLWNRHSLDPIAKLVGHTSRVEDLLFFPGEEILASSGRDETIRLWSLRDYALLRTLSGHEGKIRSIALSPDGHTLASASYDRTVRLWNVVTGDSVALIEEQDGVGAVAYSPDGQTLAYSPVQLSRSGKYVPRVILLDAHTFDVRANLLGHRGEVYSIAFSPDGNTLATASADHTVRLWDAHNGQERAALYGHTGRTRKVAFSPDGHTLASVSYDGTVKLWNGRPVPPTRRRAMVHGPSRRSGPVVRGSVANAPFAVHYRTTFHGHWSSVTNIEISPDGERIASTSSDGSLLVWDSATAKAPLALLGKDVVWNSADFSPDSQVIAVHVAKAGRQGQFLELWNVETGHRIATSPVPQDVSPVRVAFSPHGDIIALAVIRGVLMWDVTVREVRTVLETDSAVKTVRFSPDGAYLAVGCRDGRIRLWSTESWGKPDILSAHLDEVYDLSFSRDGTVLVSCSADVDRPIILWDMASGTPRFTLDGHRDFPSSVSISPDKRILVTASGWFDEVVWMWDVERATQVLSLPGHNGNAAIVRFSADGALLATSGMEGDINLWDVVSN